MVLYMKKLLNKEFILNVLIPIILGAIIGFISNTKVYGTFNKPLLSPPGIIFPIVWTILYFLMGLGNYLTNNESKFYKIQLVVNLIWPLIFFRLNWYLVAFFWLILLIVLVICMLKDFLNTKKEAFYFNLPYLFWLLFAAYLNFGVYLLN